MLLLNGNIGIKDRVMRKSFKDSLKALEADIQHANTLASDYPREYDGASLQMRLSYSPCAQFFLFLVQWTDCHFAGALGLLRILIYKVTFPFFLLRRLSVFLGHESFLMMLLQAYEDGKTSMYIHERKASIKQFYGMIFPSLLQLQRGITEIDERKQREICATKFKKGDAMNKGKLSEIEIEREEECGICMEMDTKVVLPSCNHSLCMKCYRNWRARSQSCPFCRDSLKRVDSGELWIYTNICDIKDLCTITRENMKRLLMYIEKLPVVYPDPTVVSYQPHY
ncbi:E3 ubiquitin-protein ligase AIRP2 isoform X1 [Lycium ferocissimum]|uniref:E3 ubiquitin-protein ligase AIRP2 isoform X1 n=1 Tax=Lycium ferocissimum TaxID=112874 RepID=UPI002815F121|nr:E3 ubiquitin-protein ligase AIRP2 isoform X1 [Lycium ferocissimum]